MLMEGEDLIMRQTAPSPLDSHWEPGMTSSDWSESERRGSGGSENKAANDVNSLMR